MQEWNPVVQSLYPFINPLADSLLLKIPLPNERKVKLGNSLRWDFLGVCMEIEYNDIVEPDFFAKHIEPWYAVGHFPCGWDGRQFPDGWDGIIRQGKLMVF